MSGSVRGQLARFLVVGSVTVAVDFVAYRLLLALSVPVVPAKASSFIVATILAYLLNRSWTFRSRGGTGRALAFAVLYGTTLLVNVGVNALVLHLLEDRPWSVELAFLAAQTCSTTLNFLAMRYVVFRPEQAAVSLDEPAAPRGRPEPSRPRRGQPTS